MKVTDRIDHESASAKDGEGAVLLTNGKGGFALLPQDPLSRYDGIFAMRRLGEVYKFVESVEMDEPVMEVVNRLGAVTRRRKSSSETLLMPRGHDAFLFTADKKVKARLILDCKEAYDNREWGRFYSYEPLPQGALISFSKRDDPRDPPSPYGQYDLFVAVHAPGGTVLMNDGWVFREYGQDRRRRSPPFGRSVYRAAEIFADRFIVGFGFSRSRAIANALRVEKLGARVLDEAALRSDKWVHRFPGVPQVYDVAFACAASALDSLVVDDKNVYAGLPWFFQFWPRDSAVSSRALAIIGRGAVARRLLMDHVSRVIEGVSLPNVFVAPGEPFGIIPSLDGVLWTYARVADLLKEDPSLFSAADKKAVKEKLSATIAHLGTRIDGGLVRNGPKETWMDTEFAGDDRAGCRVEMQALALAALRLAKELGIKAPPVDGLVREVRRSLWDGSMLHDGSKGGVIDKTVRPNVFIAAYVFPEILSRDEWVACVDKVLPALWLEWGGLSSIATDDPLFTPDSTGEDVRSYHRGDSWFWINNMAAIVMHRLDPVRYKRFIDGILKASTDELLFGGASGHHAEISSASALSSEGCWSQAWSDAMYVELLEELFGGKKE